MTEETLTNELDRDTHEYKKSTIISKKSDKPKADKSQHYVDNVAFYNALVERKAQVKAAEDAGLPKPQISNFIGECIMGIAKGLSNKYQFSGYTFKDEMVADAIVHCIRYIDSFDIEKSNNPFSYYTQSCYYSFLANIGEYEQRTYIKCKATMEAITGSGLSTFDGELSEDAKNIHDNLEFDTAFMTDFINKYESKQAARKERAREKATKAKGLDLLMDEDE